MTDRRLCMKKTFQPVCNSFCKTLAGAEGDAGSHKDIQPTLLTIEEAGPSNSRMPSSTSRQIPSGVSTPNLPENEAERIERDRQQEVDLHLATSMSRGVDLVSRTRSRSGGAEMQSGGSEAPYHRDAQVS